MMKKYLSLFFILLSMACSKKNRITELKMPPVIHLTGEKVETILPRCYETGVLVDSFGTERKMYGYHVLSFQYEH